MTIPTDAQLLSGNAQAVKFAAPGDSIDGTVVRKEVRPITKMGTGEVDTYKSGDIKYQILATLQTNLHEDNDDDGQRTLYIKSYMMSAVKQAVAQAGAGELEIGAWMRVTFTHYGEAERGLNPPKMYVAEYRRPDAQVLQGAVGAVQTGLGGQPVPHPQTNIATPQYAPQAQAPQYQQPSVQQAPAQPQQVAAQPAQGQPTPAQIAALRAIPLDDAAIRQIYPGWVG